MSMDDPATEPGTETPRGPREAWVIANGIARQVHGMLLTGVHSGQDCEGCGCPLHGPSMHSMRKWALLYRDDRGIFERICVHGVGHPDPDTITYMESIGRLDEDIHGCDGCCRA